MINIKTSGQRAAPIPALRSLDFIRADLFGNHAVAWVSGSFFYLPMKSPTVRRYRPRTQHITLA